MSQDPSPEQVRERVKEFILSEFLPGESADELDSTTPLITSGVVDSIATLKLVDYLEASYGIEFQAHEVDPEHLDDLTKISALVAAKLNREA